MRIMRFSIFPVNQIYELKPFLAISLEIAHNLANYLASKTVNLK